MQKDYWHFIYRTSFTPRYNGNIEKNKELKLATITNPAPVYLEQPSPIPASAAADLLGDVVNDLHFLNVCRAIRHDTCVSSQPSLVFPPKVSNIQL